MLPTPQSQMSNQKHTYTLHYFDVRGRGEPIRLIFVYHGIEYEDHRIQLDEWPAQKPDAPLGHVPYLVMDNGKLELAETLAICRYLAKSLRPTDYFAGATKTEAAKCDMYAESFMDLFTLGVEPQYEHDEAIKAKKEAHFEEQYAERLRVLEDHLKKNGGEHFVGKKALWCDLVALSVLSMLEEVKPDVLQGFPDLQAYYVNMRNLPEIKEYIENTWPPIPTNTSD
ncbi:Glutathione S-transferase protein [Trichostrongylus colubriformis]|uniref:Glutathione S-transferase protein n=1 Tax=Trichostrongylus colubriformis TaxID=6319 RepID=A0AAN8F188_TRICO